MLLRLAVHLDALRLNPAQYARCVWWWIVGKKLRARMQLAPLLARSPRAYRLWVERQNAADAKIARNHDTTARILALVVAGEGIEPTLASLDREGICARLIANAGDISSSDIEPFDWLMPITSGNILAEGAGYHYRLAVSSAPDNQQIIYADDDLIDAVGQRVVPHLKPDWNAELFRHLDFISGSAVVRVAAWQPGPNTGEDWPALFVKRAVELTSDAGQNPHHIKRVLHHRRSRPSPQLAQAKSKPEMTDAALPSVTIIIPTRNKADLLRACLDGLARTDYGAQVEIIVIDNDSDEPETRAYLASLDPEFAKVIPIKGAFNFAGLNNQAAKVANGDLLCFLNNDIEICDPHWLTIMAQQAMRKDVGAVGARLLYPDGRIQHAGVVIGIGGAAAHAHRFLHPADEGYFHRHSLPQFVTAVTAACMVVRRERFEAVQGFDADRFAVSFNDVDLCLRLGDRGWKSLYEPRATLIHHESVSRGLDRDPVGAARQEREVAALQERWNTGFEDTPVAVQEAAIDPYHHPGLSPLSEQFVLRI